MSELDLIHRARQGDEAAWETLMQDHQEYVFRLAYLLLGDADEAEDAAQEAFIRAFRFLHTFDPARNIRPWLLGITANLARNRRRAFGRYMYHLRRLARLSPGEVADPENEAAQSTRADALWEAVKRLDAGDQEIIYLRYFLELSTEETAETLNIAAGTVKSRLYRALSRLRQLAQQEFPALWAERASNE